MQKSYDEVLNLMRVNQHMVSPHIDHLVTKVILHVCPSTQLTTIAYLDGELVDRDGMEVFGASHLESGVVAINLRKHWKRMKAVIKNKPHCYTSMLVHFLIDLVDTAIHEAGHQMGLNEDETCVQAEELSWALAEFYDYNVKDWGPYLSPKIAELQREWETLVEEDEEEYYQRIQLHMLANGLSFFNPESSEVVEVHSIREGVNYHVDPDNPWDVSTMEVFHSVSANARVDEVQPSNEPDVEVEEEVHVYEEEMQTGMWMDNLGKENTHTAATQQLEPTPQTQTAPQPEPTPSLDTSPPVHTDEDDVFDESDNDSMYDDDGGWDPMDDESYAVTGNPDDPPTLVTNTGIQNTTTTTELVPPAGPPQQHAPQGSNLGDVQHTLQQVLLAIYYHVFTKCGFVSCDAEVVTDDAGNAIQPRGTFKDKWNVVDPINIANIPGALDLVVACDRYDENNKWKAEVPITDGMLRGTVSYGEKEKDKMPQYVLFLNIGGKVYRHMFTFQRPSPDGVTGGKWAKAAYNGDRIGALQSNVPKGGNIISIYGKATDENLGLAQYSVWGDKK